MTIRIKHYDGNKYEPSSRLDWENTFFCIKDFDVFKLNKKAARIAHFRVDENDTYLGITTNSGNVFVFPNSQVDLFTEA